MLALSTKTLSELLAPQHKSAIKRFLLQAYAKELKNLNSKPVWCVDEIDVDKDKITFKGWILRKSEDLPFKLLLNGNEVSTVRYPVERPDIASVFWYESKSLYSGFIASTNLSTTSFSHIIIELIFNENNNSSISYLYPLEEFFSLPDESRRSRVHGGVSLSAFKLAGYSSALALENALINSALPSFSNFNSILDWGCGCGRVARYLLPKANKRFTGVDIDQDNINWCKDNLQKNDNYNRINFFHIGQKTPTIFEDKSFDLIYGISVFTHLPESIQLEWLKELNRIAKPNAVLLMSILGDAGMARARSRQEIYDNWKKKGIVVASANKDLFNVEHESNLYVNTIHSYAYIETAWGRYFEIKDIFKNAINGYQDLVVMVKR